MLCIAALDIRTTGLAVLYLSDRINATVPVATIGPDRLLTITFIGGAG